MTRLRLDSDKLNGVASPTDLPLATRLDDLVKTCRPLPDAAAAIRFALERFHESWHGYHTVTPTLYGVREGPGVYLTLGHLRKAYGLTWATVDALTEALQARYATHGYLLTSEAVGDEPLKLLFGLQGHTHGEKHYGGLDLTTFAPFEGFITTEFDVAPETWRDLRLEAVSNSGASLR